MTAENVPFFPPGADIEKKRQLAPFACGVPGPFGSWCEWYRLAHPACWKRHPVCNRVVSHDGPHRMYDTAARVRAEWERR